MSAAENEVEPQLVNFFMFNDTYGQKEGSDRDEMGNIWAAEAGGFPIRNFNNLQLFVSGYHYLY